MSASQVEPQGKMRSRDVNKVARGEQAPRPAHEYGSISQAPPKPSPSPPSTDTTNKNTVDDDPAETAPGDTVQSRHCYETYLGYHRCVKEKGKNAAECLKFAKHYKSLCPVEWIERWDEQREHGTFHGQI